LRLTARALPAHVLGERLLQVETAHIFGPIPMLKLLLCILSAAVVAALMLELRQQRMELSFQTNRLHTQIEKSQAKLWNQQLQIAVYTAPNAITKTVGDRDLKMVPQSPLPPSMNGQTRWIDATANPDAE